MGPCQPGEKVVELPGRSVSRRLARSFLTVSLCYAILLVPLGGIGGVCHDSWYEEACIMEGEKPVTVIVLGNSEGEICRGG